MRRLSLHIMSAAAIAAMLLSACNFNKEQTTQERGMRIVEISRDSMLYGLCLGVGNDDSLRFLTDMGDTVWHRLSPDINVVGKLTPGDQLAIMLTPTSRQQEVSEFSRSIKLLAKELSVPIVAVAEGNVKGYQIGNGGAAEGINLTDVLIEGWSIYNGQLLMAGSFGVEQFIDTFNITRLTADSLRLIGRTEAHILHRMRPGEANYENAAYDFDADPTAGMDFNPELEDVEVSPEMLGEGPVY